ncbi:MAG: DUF1559 domain-containing protein, partial [Planctomycetaceae bacterium]|nr:DUF1559 domain-containing protein [Planctomycetaceae bacterium]
LGPWPLGGTYVPLVNAATHSTTQPPNGQGPNDDGLYDCVNPADAQMRRMPCLTWATSGANSYLSAAPRSRHPGGVVAVYADAHTSFLKDTVDRLTMAYLVSIDDGQAVVAE